MINITIPWIKSIQQRLRNILWAQTIAWNQSPCNGKPCCEITFQYLIGKILRRKRILIWGIPIGGGKMMNNQTIFVVKQSKPDIGVPQGSTENPSECLCLLKYPFMLGVYQLGIVKWNEYFPIVLNSQVVKPRPWCSAHFPCMTKKKSNFSPIKATYISLF